MEARNQCSAPLEWRNYLRRTEGRTEGNVLKEERKEGRQDTAGMACLRRKGTRKDGRNRWERKKG